MADRSGWIEADVIGLPLAARTNGAAGKRRGKALNFREKHALHGAEGNHNLQVIIGVHA